MNLLLIQYNNYFNRIVKKEASVAAYTSASTIQAQTFQDINFIVNDGVTTEQILNGEDLEAFDYLVTYTSRRQPAPSQETVHTIRTRWFVTECVRTRNGQYKLSLKRDLVVDFYDKIIDAPCYIEKATISDPLSPLLFNSEGIAYNQIKTSENIIADKTGCAWLVGYYDRTHQSDMSGTVVLNNTQDVTAISLGTPIASWEYYQYTTTPYNKNVVANSYRYLVAADEALTGYRYKFNNFGNLESYTTSTYGQSGLTMSLSKRFNLQTLFIENIGNLNMEADDEFAGSDGQDILSYNGKILKDSDNRYFRVSAYTNPVVTQTVNVTNSLHVDLFNEMSDTIKPGGSLPTWIQGTINNNTFRFQYQYVPIKISLEEISATEATWNFSNNTVNTTDAPYNMFAIPYRPFGDKKFTVAVPQSSPSDPEFYQLDSDNSLATIMSIAQQKGTGSNAIVYDIQLLPYCPFSYMLGGFSGEIFDIDLNSISTSQYTFVRDSSQNILSVIFNCPVSTFSFNIEQVFGISMPETALEAKKYLETSFHRLCSPNFSSSFEFNMVKNGGLDYFNVDVSCKPYSPYIHLNPNFGRLYGQDFNDPRGLICSGDFSLPIITDNWVTYENNNKNYQNIFNRQIENLEVNNKYANQMAAWSIAAGSMSGTASGAIAGSTLGPLGAVAGAAVGGAASIAGGIADLAIQKSLQKEQMNYTVDLYNYNMQNIKATPLSLTRVGSLNNNNKVFPILEYYTCTDEEKESLDNKLKYNGMTIMSISKIANYIQDEPSFIQGKIIRLLDLGEDTHLALEIYNEIAKGVFM